MFALHPRLQADSFLVDTLGLASCETCQLRLINDSRFPWLILVPEIEGATELHALEAPQRAALHGLADTLSAALAQHTQADKMNIAAIGNLVPQLHIHVIARFETDAAWPAPVWGYGSAAPYPEEKLASTLAALKALLQGL